MAILIKKMMMKSMILVAVSWSDIGPFLIAQICPGPPVAHPRRSWVIINKQTPCCGHLDEVYSSPRWVFVDLCCVDSWGRSVLLIIRPFCKSGK